MPGVSHVEIRGGLTAGPTAYIYDNRPAVTRFLRTSSILSPAVLWRGAWATLAVLHVAPIIRVGASVLSGDGGAAGFTLLAMAFAFFGLKACDARWLRLPGRHGSLAALLVLALIGHGDVAAKGVEQLPMLAPAMTFVVIGAAARAMVRRGRTLRRGMSAADPFRLRLNEMATGLLGAIIAHRPSLAPRLCFAGRAPPF
jgi:hypothetical protein